MEQFILKLADAHEDWDWEQDKWGNIYLIKGEGPYPCCVAHMDTVHAITGRGIVVIRYDDKLTGLDPGTMMQTGIGGDDKCGIYAALHCLTNLPACKVALFVDEEIGCLGSSDCDIEFFKDCRFILQADRRGNKDFVEDISGPLSSKRFRRDVAPIIKRFGYAPCKGMMSDVMALRDEQVGVACANMSAGYYNPHQDCEYIDLKDLANVVGLMMALCTELTDRYPFTYNQRSFFSRAKTLLGFGEGGGGKNIWTYDKDGKMIPSKPTKERFPDYSGSKAFGWDEEEPEAIQCWLGGKQEALEKPAGHWDKVEEEWEAALREEQEKMDAMEAQALAEDKKWEEAMAKDGWKRAKPLNGTAKLEAEENRVVGC
jgi:tripeptide aminopeptidase